VSSRRKYYVFTGFQFEFLHSSVPENA